MQIQHEKAFFIVLLAICTVCIAPRQGLAQSTPGIPTTTSAPAAQPQPASEAAEDANWPSFDPASAYKEGAGKTYYVAPEGLDILAGTKEHPLGSLRRFFQLARPGDTCLIRGGLYKAEYPNSPWARMRTNVRGEPEAWITIRNYPGERVVIDTTEPGSDFTFLNLTQSNAYLRFEGLTFRNFRSAFNCDSDKGGPPHHLEFINIDAGYSGSYGHTLHNTDGKPIRLAGGTHDVVIRGCEFHHVAGPGVVGLGGLARVLIEDTVIHDSDDDRGPNGDAEGVTFTMAENRCAKDIMVRRVSVWNCSEDGIDIKADRVTLEDCAVRNVGGVGYKLWSTWRGPGNQPLAQGRFRVIRCRGLDIGETVLKMYGLPHVEIVDSFFQGSDASTWGGKGGETTVLFRQAYGWEPWRGYLRMTGTTVVQRAGGAGRTIYPALEINSGDKVELDLEGNYYENHQRPKLAFVVEPARSAATTHPGAPAAARGTASSKPAAGGLIVLGISGPRQAAIGQPSQWMVDAVDTEGRPVDLRWDFSDGQTAAGKQVSHTCQREGKCTLRVTATAGDQTRQVEFTFEAGPAAAAPASSPSTSPTSRPAGTVSPA